MVKEYQMASPRGAKGSVLLMLIVVFLLASPVSCRGVPDALHRDLRQADLDNLERARFDVWWEEPRVLAGHHHSHPHHNAKPHAPESSNPPPPPPSSSVATPSSSVVALSSSLEPEASLEASSASFSLSASAPASFYEASSSLTSAPFSEEELDSASSSAWPEESLVPPSSSSYSPLAEDSSELSSLSPASDSEEGPVEPPGTSPPETSPSSSSSEEQSSGTAFDYSDDGEVTPDRQATPNESMEKTHEARTTGMATSIAVQPVSAAGLGWLWGLMAVIIMGAVVALLVLAYRAWRTSRQNTGWRRPNEMEMLLR